MKAKSGHGYPHGYGFCAGHEILTPTRTRDGICKEIFGAVTNIGKIASLAVIVPPLAIAATLELEDAELSNDVIKAHPWYVFGCSPEVPADFTLHLAPMVATAPAGYKGKGKEREIVEVEMETDVELVTKKRAKAESSSKVRAMKNKADRMDVDTPGTSKPEGAVAMTKKTPRRAQSSHRSKVIKSSKWVATDEDISSDDQKSRGCPTSRRVPTTSVTTDPPSHSGHRTSPSTPATIPYTIPSKPCACCKRVGAACQSNRPSGVCTPCKHLHVKCTLTIPSARPSCGRKASRAPSSALTRAPSQAPLRALSRAPSCAPSHTPSCAPLRAPLRAPGPECRPMRLPVPISGPNGNSMLKHRRRQQRLRAFLASKIAIWVQVPSMPRHARSTTSPQPTQAPDEGVVDTQPQTTQARDDEVVELRQQVEMLTARLEALELIVKSNSRAQEAVRLHVFGEQHLQPPSVPYLSPAPVTLPSSLASSRVVSPSPAPMPSQPPPPLPSSPLPLPAPLPSQPPPPLPSSPMPSPVPVPSQPPLPLPASPLPPVQSPIAAPSLTPVDMLAGMSLLPDVATASVAASPLGPFAGVPGVQTPLLLMCSPSVEPEGMVVQSAPIHSSPIAASTIPAMSSVEDIKMSDGAYPSDSMEL
ncbi:hypothetical protein BU15DRAFT_79334 [Melanogaster broomeanus]|nr:hypothetical protein BU15DRAFT_79334 [Melanogaster broomeanus]